MKDFDNVSQARRITSILYWFGKGEKFTMRELAKRLIEQFQPNKSNKEKSYDIIASSRFGKFIHHLSLCDV